MRFLSDSSFDRILPQLTLRNVKDVLNRIQIGAPSRDCEFNSPDFVQLILGHATILAGVTILEEQFGFLPCVAVLETPGEVRGNQIGE